MALHHVPVRHSVSTINPALIESWCLKCGMFIAASDDEKKLQAAEDSHPCVHEDPDSYPDPANAV